MPRTPKSALLNGLRLILVCVGIGIAVMTVHKLASMPPPPPDSDGFAYGMAAIIGTIIIVLSLGLAAVAVSLPSVIGLDDLLGFTRSQRIVLKGAAGLIVGGFLIALLYGFFAGLQFGIVLWLAIVALATTLVGITVVWRLTESVIGILVRTLRTSLA